MMFTRKQTRIQIPPMVGVSQHVASNTNKMYIQRTGIYHPETQQSSMTFEFWGIDETCFFLTHTNNLSGEVRRKHNFFLWKCHQNKEVESAYRANRPCMVLCLKFPSFWVSNKKENHFLLQENLPPAAVYLKKEACFCQEHRALRNTWIEHLSSLLKKSSWFLKYAICRFVYCFCFKETKHKSSSPVFAKDLSRNHKKLFLNYTATGCTLETLSRCNSVHLHVFIYD